MSRFLKVLNNYDIRGGVEITAETIGENIDAAIIDSLDTEQVITRVNEEVVIPAEKEDEEDKIIYRLHGWKIATEEDEKFILSDVKKQISKGGTFVKHAKKLGVVAINKGLLEQTKSTKELLN